MIAAVDLKYWQGSYDFYCDAGYDGAVSAAMERDFYGPPDHWHGPDVEWDQNYEARTHTRAIAADEGETA